MTLLVHLLGVERIPARNWIEMVNGIFEAMLCDYRPGKKDRNNTTGTLGSKKMTFPSAPRNGSVNLDKSAVGSTESTSDMAELRPDNEDSENDEGVEDDDDTDLTYAAVHIFLYFIQVRWLIFKLTSCHVSRDSLTLSKEKSQNRGIMDEMSDALMLTKSMIFYCNMFVAFLFSQINREKRTEL